MKQDRWLNFVSNFASWRYFFSVKRPNWNTVCFSAWYCTNTFTIFFVENAPCHWALVVLIVEDQENSNKQNTFAFTRLICMDLLFVRSSSSLRNVLTGTNPASQLNVPRSLPQILAEIFLYLWPFCIPISCGRLAGTTIIYTQGIQENFHSPTSPLDRIILLFLSSGNVGLRKVPGTTWNRTTPSNVTLNMILHTQFSSDCNRKF